MASPAAGQPRVPTRLASLHGSRQDRAMNETIAALVRRHDPDRFLTALFAPSARRDALLILYAFNHELARAREVASEPPLALIRLQWWREVVEGADRRHEVASPLSAAIAAGELQAATLLPLIEAREAEAYADFDSLNDWRAWLRAGAGGLAVAAAAALGAPDPEALRPFGAAYGVAGLLRSTGLLASRNQCLLPAALLAAHGLTHAAFVQAPDAEPARAALASVAEEGRALLAEAARTPLPRQAVPAALPAVLARRDLRRWPAIAVPRGIGDRLAVMAAGITGRLSLRG
jgi:phytoene synthase